MARHPKTIELKQFNGINNQTPAEKTPVNYFKEIVNLDIDKAHNISKRKGYQLVEAGDFHSLYSDKFIILGVKDGDLVEIDSCNYSTTVLLVGVGDNPISFERVDNTVYFASTSLTGKIINGEVFSWGIEKPGYSPTLTAGSGSLGAGTYTVTWTFEYANGQESGSVNPSFIELPANSSINIASFPTVADSNITKINIYATHQNGIDLYLVAQLPTTQTSFSISNTFNLDKILRTINMAPPPNGHIVKWFQGRLYIADGNVLWFTEPYEYDLINLRGNYVLMDSDITAVCPVETGIWVSDKGKTYFLQGRDPRDFKRVEKEPVSIVPGSDVKIHGDLIAIENTPVGYKWLVTSERGVHVLFNDGLIINVTQKNVSYPSAVRSSAALFEEDGIAKYISLLQEKEPSNNTRVGDTVTSTIVRNGITIV